MKLDFSPQALEERQRQVEAGLEVAESMAEKHFFKRLDRLVAVRRFVIGWMLFFILMCGCLVGQIRALDGQFKSLQPVEGGIYTEGILGDFTTANPLYASGEADESVSRLLFAGLLTYDDHNKLVGDLASDWQADPTEKVYTVHLKPNLTWQDGATLTAQDVLFTYQTIQNPDALSNLAGSWKDIKVAAPDDRTVTFTLPNPLSGFSNQLTTGIIPAHLLKDIPVAQLRSNDFNTTHPVGAGPFSLQKIQVSGETPQNRQEQIALAPFKQYNGGTPKLARYIVHAFHDQNKLNEAFTDKVVTGAGLMQVPEKLKNDANIRQTNLLMTAANMVFFRENTPVLGDVNVRKALVMGADVPALIGLLDFQTRPVKEPILQNQIGYDPAYAQPSYDPAAANALLDKNGWVRGANGFRSKGATPLMFSLQASDSSENHLVVARLQNYWKALGVRATVQLRSNDDLQRSITSKDYEALLYGISIGADPDVFVYWDSSQNDPRSARLNFSHFSSKAADAALEGARTRSDPSLRAVKLKPFLQAWQQDSPALGLYQPRYLYVTHGKLYGLNEHTINSDIDRYNNVQNWEIREAEVTNH